MKFKDFLAFLLTLLAILVVVAGLIFEVVTLFTEKSCEDYSLFLIPEETKINVEVGKGKLVKLKAVNAGKFIDKYKVEVDGPDWIVVKPESFSLEPEGMKTIFLYISPELGSEGKYEATVTVKSDCVQKSQKIDIGVLSNFE